MKLTESRIKEIILEEISAMDNQQQDIEQLEKEYNNAVKKITDKDVKAHIIAYVATLKGNK